MIKNKILYLRLGKILGLTYTGLLVIFLITELICKFVEITHYVKDKDGLEKIKPE